MTKRQLKGTVVSNKMQKTVVVKVTRYVKHPKYGKYFSVAKKYKAHEETGKFNVGDEVMIEECSPMSRDKHFKVVSGTASKGTRAAEVEDKKEEGITGGIKKFLHIS